MEETKYNEKRFDCVIYSKDKRNSYNISFNCHIDSDNTRGCIELYSDDIRLQEILKFENRETNLISVGYVRYRDLKEVDDELVSNAISYFYLQIGPLGFSEVNIKPLLKKMLLWLKSELEVLEVYKI